LLKPANRIAGTVTVPGDKSISHRALMLGGIAVGRTEITGFLPSEDCLASLKAMRALGVTVTQQGPTQCTVEGVGLRGLTAPAGPLDMGNAGTAMRLFTGLLSAQCFNSELIGDASLMQRPMERVAKPLRAMGADIVTEAGKPPVRIRGGRALHGILYPMPVASAQVKSAVLLAGLYAEGETCIIEPAVSRDHSERMLEGFGATLHRDGAKVSISAPAKLVGQRLQVPGDISSAAFFIVAALLAAASEGLLIANVGMNPTRTGLLTILRAMGARIDVQNARHCGAEPVADLRVMRSTLHGIDVPAEYIPLAIDEIPVLFIAAACASGVTRVTGAEELRVKESDRIASMAAGLAALGVRHEVLADGMRIEGKGDGPAFGGGVIQAQGDHRIAMAFAVASLRASKEIEILDVANVATSFPGFASLARVVGFDLQERCAAP
jgi:3-phosphoshikimate 1-carboxyvinyltransferase